MKTRRFVTVFFTISLLLILSMVLLGCRKKSEPIASPNTVSVAEPKQTICPVMEAPIDKNVYVMYQGKKVYFCCNECKGKFEKEPEKYLSKLPQFSK